MIYWFLEITLKRFPSGLFYIPCRLKQINKLNFELGTGNPLNTLGQANYRYLLVDTNQIFGVKYSRTINFRPKHLRNIYLAQGPR